MSKLIPVSWPELIKKLRKLGFEGPYQGGKHPFMVRKNLVLTLPNPHKKEIGRDLLSRILRQAKITRKDWLNIK